MVHQESTVGADGPVSQVPAADGSVMIPGARDLVAHPGDAVSRLINAGWTYAVNFGPRLLGALLLLAAAYVLAGWMRRVVIRACTVAKIDATLSRFFGNLAKWTIVIFALVTAAGTIGISTTGFAAAIGAAGLAVGLALQGNLGNLAAGVLLLIFRPFKVGDTVIVAGQTGLVEGIDLFTTNLDTVDNRRLIIPNGAIFGGSIENQTHNPRRRIDYAVTLGGGVDIELARAMLVGVLARVVDAGDGALFDPPYSATLNEIAPNQSWALTLWAATPRGGAGRERLLIELRRAIDSNKMAPPPVVQIVRHVE